MVLTHGGSSRYHFTTPIVTPAEPQPCDSQRGKYHCKTEGSCFHNRANCTLHHRSKLVVKTVIKTDSETWLTWKLLPARHTVLGHCSKTHTCIFWIVNTEDVITRKTYATFPMWHYYFLPCNHEWYDSKLTTILIDSQEAPQRNWTQQRLGMSYYPHIRDCL